MGILVLMAAYLVGAIPFGYLLVRWKTGADIRASGSGNIGATNVMRTVGGAAAIATLLLDIAKGFFAVWLAGRLTSGQLTWMSGAALAVMIGHAYPVFLGFRGGKAVASFLGAFLYLAPLAVAAALIVFAGMVVWTRHISAGSITAAGTFPLAVWLILHPPWPLLLAALAAGALVVHRHQDNIRRLRAGTESVFALGTRKR